MGIGEVIIAVVFIIAITLIALVVLAGKYGVFDDKK